MYKGFNLETIINTKAKTKSAKSLRDKISKNASSVKSARRASKQSKSMNYDELDLRHINSIFLNWEIGTLQK